MKTQDAQVATATTRRAPLEGPRDRERLRTVVVPDHDDLALRLADHIVAVIARETTAKGH